MGYFHGFPVNRLEENGTLSLMVSNTDFDNEKREYRKNFYGYENPDLNGLISVVNYNYVFEIKPVSANAFDLRIILCADPKLPDGIIAIKQALTRQFMGYILKKMIRVGRDFKGTVFEKRQKEREDEAISQLLRKEL